MSTDSEIFIKEIHMLISDSVRHAEKMLFGTDVTSNDYLGGNINEEDINNLRSIHLTDKQKQSINRLLTAVGRLSVVGVLSVIDGVVMSDKFDLPDLSLVNRQSHRDIADDLPLNEEFYQYEGEA